MMDAALHASSHARGSLRLTDLRAGARARLLGTSLDPDTRDLLRSLGLTDAASLHVCKHGEPCIIQVRGTRIGLSRAVASGILVALDDRSGHGEPR
jgi:Fe2+ transport system protein FeoA